MNQYESGLFLYNGNKKEEAGQNLQQVLPVLAKAISRLHVMQTTSLEELHETCKEYAPAVDVMIILGGDGTIHECINAIAGLKKRPAVAILPSGTCNDFSRMLGMPQNMRQAAEAIANGQTRAVDIGQSDSRYFLNFWGIGLVTETSINIDKEQKRRLGVLSYFLSTLRTINQAEPFGYRIKADGEEIKGEAVLIVILNGKYIGTQEIPVSAITPHDGMLDILIVKNSSLAMFRELMMMNQEDVNTETLTELSHLQVSQAEIEVKGQEERQIDMDGEIVDTVPASIRVLPKHVKMIVNE
ncbi:YegS/Rv2252/BmrU family lipid kinase [Sediminibacillus dalangtanensis]|uniref:YegS/Rv2252/BmrU family lipid kinase n=1 Tax=Sediminibacillus dalangtanensis TaxID=2729421 RepID=A0ABX7VWV8_9BACI|nr:YegS/Rv2252/BmrU family lipid kinase [Sediminibacillus dalangtanensis]